MTDRQAKAKTLPILKKWAPVYGLGDFGEFVMPVIRQMAEMDIIEQLVEVQPMTVPHSHIFYIEYVRDKWYKRIWSDFKDMLADLMWELFEVWEEVLNVCAEVFLIFKDLLRW